MEVEPDIRSLLARGVVNSQTATNIMSGLRLNSFLGGVNIVTSPVKGQATVPAGCGMQPSSQLTESLVSESLLQTRIKSTVNNHCNKLRSASDWYIHRLCQLSFEIVKLFLVLYTDNSVFSPCSKSISCVFAMAAGTFPPPNFTLIICHRDCQ